MCLSVSFFDASGGKNPNQLNIFKYMSAVDSTFNISPCLLADSALCCVDELPKRKFPLRSIISSQFDRPWHVLSHDQFNYYMAVKILLHSLNMQPQLWCSQFHFFSLKDNAIYHNIVLTVHLILPEEMLEHCHHYYFFLSTACSCQLLEKRSIRWRLNFNQTCRQSVQVFIPGISLYTWYCSFYLFIFFNTDWVWPQTCTHLTNQNEHWVLFDKNEKYYNNKKRKTALTLRYNVGVSTVVVKTSAYAKLCSLTYVFFFG